MPTDQIITRHTNCPIYLVEDEDSLRHDLCFLLQAKGYQVTACASASEFYRQFAVRPAGVVVLDIGLEGEDGLSICQHLRAHDPLLGIIFLTARSLRDDRVNGLMIGADAYMVKPVELDELCLTIDRLEDRRQVALASGGSAAHSGLGRLDPLPETLSTQASALPELPAGGQGGSWGFDLASGLLTAPNGQSRRLTGNERTVVYCLAQHGGHPVSVEGLATQLLFPNPSDGKHRVEVIISRLRRSVEQSVGQALPLFLLRGVGYCLRDVRISEG